MNMPGYKGQMFHRDPSIAAMKGSNLCPAKYQIKHSVQPISIASYIAQIVVLMSENFGMCINVCCHTILGCSFR